ncbi:hypothetical protein NDU88_006783 [Pleurodeles waltl]|uniref:Myb/SANT-like DNA-binding domain-containing protein n=1 Tax=Pleurodeles waltl TaxID=8319 RepID=A0AAV7RMG1_PLEWA|nr:hypothetical protein NDU88_006783 [Pleurodeles waltl]
MTAANRLLRRQISARQVMTHKHKPDRSQPQQQFRQSQRMKKPVGPITLPTTPAIHRPPNYRPQITTADTQRWSSVGGAHCCSRIGHRTPTEANISQIEKPTRNTYTHTVHTHQQYYKTHPAQPTIFCKHEKLTTPCQQKIIQELHASHTTHHTPTPITLCTRYIHHILGMSPQKNPRFTDEELRVMVEEIARVEPQLFGAQVQQISIARKMELWQRIVDRVNFMGTYPRTWDDIQKRWIDLRGKVREVASRHQIAIMKTGSGPPPPPPQLTAWEEKVLAILHSEGLTGVTGGLDTGTTANVSGEHVPLQPSPPPEDALSDDSNSGCPDLDDLPGQSGTTGQLASISPTQSTTGAPHLTPTPHHLPNVPKPLSPGHVDHLCAHLHRDLNQHHKGKTMKALV